MHLGGEEFDPPAPCVQSVVSLQWWRTSWRHRKNKRLWVCVSRYTIVDDTLTTVEGKRNDSREKQKCTHKILRVFFSIVHTSDANKKKFFFCKCVTWVYILFLCVCVCVDLAFSCSTYIRLTLHSEKTVYLHRHTYTQHIRTYITYTHTHTYYQKKETKRIKYVSFFYVHTVKYAGAAKKKEKCWSVWGCVGVGVCGVYVHQHKNHRKKH
jgi:hypothetical protein